MKFRDKLLLSKIAFLSNFALTFANDIKNSPTSPSNGNTLSVYTINTWLNILAALQTISFIVAVIIIIYFSVKILVSKGETRKKSIRTFIKALIIAFLIILSTTIDVNPQRNPFS